MDDWKSPLFRSVDFCVTEFMPVTALLLSFWYGLFRRNKVIRSRKYSTGGNVESLDKSPQFFDYEDADDDEQYSNNPFGIG